MFASLGFQVDSAGLETFKSGLKQAKESMNGLTSEVKAAKKPLEDLKRKLTDIGKVKLSFGSAKNSANLKSSVKGVNDQLDKLITRRSGVTDALGKINSALIVGAGYWDKYREKVVSARTSLHNINSELRTLRANSNITVKVNRQNGGGGGGGGRSGVGGASLAGGLLGLGAAKHFFGSFLPAAALATTAGSMGYIARGAINQGREQTKMETMLMMTAKSTDHFRDSLKYVREEALRLGLSSVELGKSFAQISMSARGLNQEQKKEMFTGFSEFMVAMGTNKDDQKGVFRAFNQMFGAGRILQEEINQLTERGIPATLIMDAAKQAYNTEDTQFIKKLQKDGKLDPNKVLPIMAKMVQQLAHDTGALDRMQKSSLYKQQVFMETLSQFSQRLMDSGLDEWLGNVFGKLTELVDVLDEVVGGVKYLAEMYKKLQAETDGTALKLGGLILTLGFIFLRFGHIVKAVRLMGTALRGTGGIARAFNIFLTGSFGSTLGRLIGTVGKVIGKFFVWISVIGAVIKGFRYLNKEMKRRDDGELTIFDRMIWTLQEIEALVGVVGAAIEWTWVKFTNMARDINTFELPFGQGEYQFFSNPFSSPMDLSTPMPNRQSGGGSGVGGLDLPVNIPKNGGGFQFGPLGASVNNNIIIHSSYGITHDISQTTA